jgi:hypothetical protein
MRFLSCFLVTKLEPATSYKTFFAMLKCLPLSNKLERLSPSETFALVKKFWAKPELTRVDHKAAVNGVLPAIQTNIKQGLKYLPLQTL